MQMLTALVILATFGDAPEEIDPAVENEPEPKTGAESAPKPKNELSLRAFNLVLPDASKGLYAALGVEYMRRLASHVALGGFADFGIGSYGGRATIVRVAPSLRAEANPTNWFRTWGAVALPYSSRGSANEYSTRYASTLAIEVQVGLGLESSRVLFGPFGHAGVELDTGYGYFGGGVALALKF